MENIEFQTLQNQRNFELIQKEIDGFVVRSHSTIIGMMTQIDRFDALLKAAR
jgi:hypothetical protein